MRLIVRVRPGASRTRVGGRHGEGDEAALVVAVSERAVDGAATAAVLAAVAQAFEVRTRAVTLVTGATSRTKVLDVDIDDAEGHRRWVALLDSDVGRQATPATNAVRPGSANGTGPRGIPQWSRLGTAEPSRAESSSSAASIASWPWPSWWAAASSAGVTGLTASLK